MSIFLRSGQVRSECLTCTFRGSCCSTCLSRDRKRMGGEDEGEPPALVGTSRPESVAGGGCLRCYGIWNDP